MTTDTLLGKQLDEYRLEKLLGKGGMARVYRGMDTRLKRYVAIKVIDTPFLKNSEYLERFEKEAQAIAQLHHPNIVTLYRYNEVSGFLYMAMQYVEGADLEKLISDTEESNRIPLVEVLPIIRQLCDALDYAHSKGVIHRDVKPSNIMVEPDGHVFLTDFGLALVSEVGTLGEIFGSPHYIAPEQAISSAGAVPQSDYYSVGVVLYEILAGRLPFESDNPMDLAMMHITESPPPPRQFRPDLSSEVEAVILRLLAKEPNDRFENGKALITAFEAAISADADASSTRPPLSIANRVSAELEKNPLPPIPRAMNSASVNTPQRPASFRGQPFAPILLIGGSALMMLLCVAAFLILFFNYLDEDNPPTANQSIPATETPVPATATPTVLTSPEPSPTSTSPPVFVLLQNGVGLSTGRPVNEGAFEVEGYCNGEFIEGYSEVSHDNANWYCHRQENRSDSVQLTQTDFDLICQLTYSDPNAIARQVGGTSIPAFNWKCFGPLPLDGTAP